MQNQHRSPALGLTCASRKHALTGFSVLASVFALVGSAEAQAAAPSSTILYNGKVFTAASASPWAEAVAVEGDHIIAVGTNRHVLSRKRPNTKVINLAGRTVIPGLNNAHVHMLAPLGVTIMPPTWIPGHGPTVSEVLASIAEAAQSTPPGTWLTAFVGMTFLDDPNANRFALDVVSPDHPVRLTAWSGHGMVINTKAMETLGMPTEAPDPFAGTYDRLPDSDVLNGVLNQYAGYELWRRLYQLMSDDELVAQYQTLAADGLQLGFTSIQDMAVGIEQSRSVKLLHAAKLPVRFRSMCFPLTPDEPCDSIDGRDDTHLLRFSGIKWISDGTPVERWAYMREPYADRPDWSGWFDLPPSALDQIMDHALRGNPSRNQLIVHVIGDAANDVLLDGFYGHGGRRAWEDRRPRMEHCDLLTPDNYQRVKNLGAVVVQNGTHLACPEVFAEHFTPEQNATVQPLHSLLDAGITLGLGTDSIGGLGNPWVDLLLTTIHPDNPAEAITLEQAITAYTRGSAYAEFEDDHKGTLSAGKLADLVVLSQDVFTVPPMALPATTSVLTMIDGQVVWDAGVLHH